MAIVLGTNQYGKSEIASSASIATLRGTRSAI